MVEKKVAQKKRVAGKKKCMGGTIGVSSCQLGADQSIHMLTQANTADLFIFFKFKQIELKW